MLLFRPPTVSVPPVLSAVNPLPESAPITGAVAVVLNVSPRAAVLPLLTTAAFCRAVLLSTDSSPLVLIVTVPL